MSTLCDFALDVLGTENAIEKADKTRAYIKIWRKRDIPIGIPAAVPDRPARPGKPELKHPNEMPKRGKAGSLKSKIALLHALAHIELNAIDLSWDIMVRFSHFHTNNNNDLPSPTPLTLLNRSEAALPSPIGRGLGEGADPLQQTSNGKKDTFTLPRTFFDEWAKVADDEAKHFRMLESRLNDLGASYGDLPAHDGLWDSAIRTADNFAARLAVVPMVLEARGLDVTPGMIETMKKQGDDETADMLQIIHDDEVTHVRAGTVWFEAWCKYHNLDVETHWQRLVQDYFTGVLKRPFNHPSRENAGLLRHWYEPLADAIENT